MRRLKLLNHRRRCATNNRALGLFLAFNAGAVNAGGFLVLHTYTSHMTGFTSQLADGLMLGRPALWLNALGAILAFVAGAAVRAILVNWARQRHLHGVYALPLMLEASLMLTFGWMGTAAVNWPTAFSVPVTVLLLAFIMGLQNAVASKTSGGSIRTTHMTGNITDLGIELGKLLYWNGAENPQRQQVRHNRLRLRLATGLVMMFVSGSLVGALGFKSLGFICVLPLALLLLGLSIPPLWQDGLRLLRRIQFARPKHQRPG